MLWITLQTSRPQFKQLHKTGYSLTRGNIRDDDDDDDDDDGLRTPNIILHL